MVPVQQDSLGSSTRDCRFLLFWILHKTMITVVLYCFRWQEISVFRFYDTTTNKGFSVWFSDFFSLVFRLFEFGFQSFSAWFSHVFQFGLVWMQMSSVFVQWYECKCFQISLMVWMQMSLAISMNDRIIMYD